MNSTDKAELFKGLHKKGDPLVIYNIWDAGGAKALEEAGANAIATGSWAVAAAQGFGDGEIIPLDFVLQIVERISASINVPLSVDFEGAYSVEPEGITVNVRKIIKAGAVGINFEDQIVGGEGLYPIDVQAERIRAVREAARLEGIPLFINARNDVFLALEMREHAAHVAQAIEREAAYSEAGADGFFIPGLTQLDLIEQVVDSATLPVNVLLNPASGSISDVTGTGVSRVSCGPGSYRSAMSDLAGRYKSLR